MTIEGKSGAVTAKTVTAEEYKVGNKTYISSDGLNANSQKITNVQAGTADTDAANVGQVREADEQLAGGIAQNARNISQLGREVDKLDSRIDRVAPVLRLWPPSIREPMIPTTKWTSPPGTAITGAPAQPLWACTTIPMNGPSCPWELPWAAAKTW